MKITDDTQIKKLVQEPSPSRTKSNEIDFAKTLARSFAQKSKESQQPFQNSQATSVSQTLLTGPLTLAGGTETFQHLENTIGLLDRYAKALADPGQTLKDVSGLVKEMEQAVDDLKTRSQNLPEGHAIKDLADRIAIITVVEAAKFNRGDYL